MGNSNTRRIVLLGKSGIGKSSLANTILGEEVFKVNHGPNSETKTCQSVTRSINGSEVQLVDTPGFFDTDPYNKNLEPVVKCVVECAPGPHVFLIVLNVGKYTEQEQAIVSVILQYFSDEALKFATVVFTHGDQLEMGKTIVDFVSENPGLNELVEKCGGRCHVFDNKYWNNKQQDEYRSNRFQIKELIKTIDKTIEENNGGYYTNEMLQSVEENMQQEEERIRLLPGNKSPEKIKEEAKGNVFKKILSRVAGTFTGILLGGLLGGLAIVSLVPQLTFSVIAATVAVAAAVTGGVVGGYQGYQASADADTPQEAIELVLEEARPYLDKIKSLLNVHLKEARY